jgi:Peptidase A4 family
MESTRSLRCGSWVNMIFAVAVTAVGSGGSPIRIAVKPLAWRQHRPVVIHRQRDQQQWESSNWSGYAVTGANGSVTDAKASWKVPQAVCPTNTANGSGGYASFWVGIDGWSSNTVEQIGTDSDCVSLSGAPYTPTYYAWFEFYPQNSYYLEFGNGQCKSMPSSSTCMIPGDVISAEVKYSGTASGGHGAHGGGPEFTVTITDVTQGWTYSTSSVVSGAKQTSAEWIAETPCCQKGGQFLPLADFGTADYGADFTSVQSTSYATVSSITGPIGSFGNNVQESTMVSDSSCSGAACPVMAQPSGLSADGSSFSVAWMNAGP